MDLYLVDDAVARNWQPFALTRPIGELMFGTSTLRARTAALTGAQTIGHVTRPELAGFEEPEAPPVVRLDLSPSDRPRLFLWSRAVLAGPLPRLPEDRSLLLEVGGRFAGISIPAGTAGAETLFASAVEGRPESSELTVVDLQGFLLDSPWDLMARSADQIVIDGAGFSDAEVPAGTDKLGDGRLSIEKGTFVEPSVVFDTRSGPVILDEDVHVHAFTRVAGPAYVGPGSILLGGSF
ncbi:MAG: putative sugar nucleotidyl transferase, partial [Gemmatimonadota bacterium]|nr:putative sugar nucleotidyl transferase [Gemmatimonadota bacterium]